MKILVQRVKQASVYIPESSERRTIGPGLLVFLGIHRLDKAEQTDWLINKLISLRLFADSQGKMNLNLQEIGGDLLIVSQFTLYGNCLKGRRPDFIESASPEIAEMIYNKFVAEVRLKIKKVETGQFGAYMEVSLINDGPVTFLIESPNKQEGAC